jgi:hypothetical protein
MGSLLLISQLKKPRVAAIKALIISKPLEHHRKISRQRLASKTQRYRYGFMVHISDGRDANDQLNFIVEIKG